MLHVASVFAGNALLVDTGFAASVPLPNLIGSKKRLRWYDWPVKDWLHAQVGMETGKPLWLRYIKRGWAACVSRAAESRCAERLPNLALSHTAWEIGPSGQARKAITDCGQSGFSRSRRARFFRFVVVSTWFL